MGLNPAKVARQGIEKFRKENRDLIIVDTNSRHNHYTSLFEEMSQIAKIMVCFHACSLRFLFLFSLGANKHI